MSVSRRYVLVAGAGALVGGVGVASARWIGRGSSTQDLIRRWYALWEKGKTDWGPLDQMLADDFTFSSAAGDDHISKSTFKSRCWQTNIEFIDRCDLEQVFTTDDDALVKYLGHTTNGKSFRNVEYFRFKNNRIAELTCYFGEASSFPAAVSTGQKA